MKLTIIILLTTVLHLQAAHSYSQQVTLQVKNASLPSVFKQIEQQTGYLFWYNTDLLKNAKNVDVNVKNATLQEALYQCFLGQHYTYEIVSKTIVIKEMPMPRKETVAPPDTIRGIVYDFDAKHPLPGASVRVKGKSMAAVTNDSGMFGINAAPGDVLVITYTGYDPVETTVVAGEKLSIDMKLSVKSLTEITVSTGYQVLPKERSAGAFAKPDMNIVKDRSGSMNILQRLDGMIPGLTVNNAPMGANASSPILIRGLTTIGVFDNDYQNYQGAGTNRNPLYVVDGIQMDDVSSINPQDVADVTVLKDATAASIWGSRASNGVIVITTKKGTFNDKIKVVYDGFINFQGKPDLRYMPVLNSRQYIDAYRAAFEDPNAPTYASLYPWSVLSSSNSVVSTGVAPHEVIMYNKVRGLINEAQAKAGLDSLAAIDNRSQIADLWYRNASLMNHTVSLSGGGAVHSFYGSLAYTDARSNRPGEDNKTYKANLRQDFNFNKRIRAYLITDLTNTTTAAKRNALIENNFYPYQLFRDAKGNNLAMPYIISVSDSLRQDYQNRSRISLDYIPLDEYNYGYTRSEGMLARITSGITIQLLKGLRFEGVYGFVKGNTKTQSFDDERSYLVRNELVQFTVAPTASSKPVYYLPTTGGRYAVTNAFQRNWTVRNQLAYENDWKNRMHQLNILVGQEAQEQLTATARTTVRGYNEMLQTAGMVDYATLTNTGVANPVIPNNFGRSILSNTSMDNMLGEIELLTRFTSYYANAAYTLKRKYSLNTSWRIDQSNLFGRDKSAQNRPVWSAGAKWSALDEDFLQSLQSKFDMLSLRVTYGITGSSSTPGTASSFDIMRAGSSNFLQNGMGLSIISPANRALTWETTRTINLGLDFSILNGRISGAIDCYQKKTSDLLGNFEVNGFSGYNVINGNMGDMENKGFELSLSTINIHKASFSWSSFLTMAYNRNKITRLNTSVPISTGDQKVIASYLPGYPAFAIFAYKYAGLDAMGDPQIALQDKTVSKALNVATPEDIRFMGTFQPVWSGGFSNTFRYKGLSLSVNAIYNLGHVMRKDVNTFFYGRFGHTNVMPNGEQGYYNGNIHADFLNRWQQPGDEANTDIPAYIASPSISGSRRNTMYYTYADKNVLSASFIKIRDITLAYDLPRSITSRIKTDGITLRLQMSNFMLWTANKEGIDPEFHNPIGGVRSLPANQRTITIGAHVAF